MYASAFNDALHTKLIANLIDLVIEYVPACSHDCDSFHKLVGCEMTVCEVNQFKHIRCTCCELECLSTCCQACGRYTCCRCLENCENCAAQVCIPNENDELCQRVRCEMCDQTLCRKCSTSCELCSQQLCLKCSSSCETCDTKGCPKCLKSCSICDRGMCQDCESMCLICEDRGCEICIDKGKCHMDDDDYELPRKKSRV